MTLADRLFRELVFCDVEAALVPDGAEPSRHFFPELLVHLIQRHVGQRERFDRAPALHLRFDPHKSNGECDRLCDIIICAQFQPFDDVGVLIVAREHDHREGVGRISHFESAAIPTAGRGAR